VIIFGGEESLNLEQKFHRAMINIYERAKKECNYTATAFIQDVSKIGGLATAKKLLLKKM
jgi:aromatic ring hydroxylase